MHPLQAILYQMVTASGLVPEDQKLVEIITRSLAVRMMMLLILINEGELSNTEEGRRKWVWFQHNMSEVWLERSDRFTRQCDETMTSKLSDVKKFLQTATRLVDCDVCIDEGNTYLFHLHVRATLTLFTGASSSSGRPVIIAGTDGRLLELAAREPQRSIVLSRFPLLTSDDVCSVLDVFTSGVCGVLVYEERNEEIRHICEMLQGRPRFVISFVRHLVNFFKNHSASTTSSTSSSATSVSGRGSRSSNGDHARYTLPEKVSVKELLFEAWKEYDAAQVQPRTCQYGDEKCCDVWSCSTILTIWNRYYPHWDTSKMSFNKYLDEVTDMVVRERGRDETEEREGTEKKVDTSKDKLLVKNAVPPLDGVTLGLGNIVECRIDPGVTPSVVVDYVIREVSRLDICGVVMVVYRTRRREGWKVVVE